MAESLVNRSIVAELSFYDSCCLQALRDHCQFSADFFGEDIDAFSSMPDEAHPTCQLLGHARNLFLRVEQMLSWMEHKRIWHEVPDMLTDTERFTYTRPSSMHDYPVCLNKLVLLERRAAVWRLLRPLLRPHHPLACPFLPREPSTVAAPFDDECVEEF